VPIPLPDPVRLDLVVLRSPDVAATRAFYEALGLRFVDERHGAGPPHVATTLAGGVVVEIYPDPTPAPAPGPRLGFTVPDVDAVLAALGLPAAEAEVGAGGGRAVVVTDPDGRPVHLSDDGRAGGASG
jgi:lactoylglutathione lyase